jgi:spore germination cell wall hydrolase CwlJ-like protein
MEAGGEGRVGMEAVAEVIFNRADKRKLTPYDVVMQRLQFSCVNGRTAEEVVQIGTRRWPNQFADAENMVRDFSVGRKTRHTGGADHYYAHKKVNPSWASRLTTTAVIGNHTFLR